MSKENAVFITTSNVFDYLGDIKLSTLHLKQDVWDFFDKDIFDSICETILVDLNNVISRKNQLLDPDYLTGKKIDPRITAYNRMCDAAKGEIPKRPPIKILCRDSKRYDIVDGNATCQVLMLLNFPVVPAQICTD